MGCDIHTIAEKRINGKWVKLYSPFNWRQYGMYGFLADVRNYHAIPPISLPRGVPEDSSFDYDDYYYHSGSWLSMQELLDFNYEQIIEDRRCTVQTGPNSWNGGATCRKGQGTEMSYKEFLGKAFFKDLEFLKELEAERIVFAFDN